MTREVESLVGRLDALVEEAVEGQTVVGASVIVSRDGNILYQRLAGWTDREHRRPVGPDTLFRLASMTKPIVSATILALVEEGDLEIDAPVTKYLPWFRPKWQGEEPPISIFQLLTHTSGLACGFAEPTLGHPYSAAGVSDGLDITASVHYWDTDIR